MRLEHLFGKYPKVAKVHTIVHCCIDRGKNFDETYGTCIIIVQGFTKQARKGIPGQHHRFPITTPNAGMVSDKLYRV